MKNIHILPTDKPSRLIQAEDDELMLLNELYENTHNINKHIYITSDEEIKKGDWVLNPIYKTVYKWIKNSDIYFDRIDAKKIILTTDQDLIKDGVQDIDNDFLEWFVKNPSCDEVEVIPLRKSSGWYDEKEVWHWDFLAYKIIIPKEEPKQEITIEEIEQQITLTEARGERVIKYLDKYKGQSIYNEIALAIEFGYQLKLEEDE